MSGYRLPSGGAIDRDVSLTFRFNGRTLHGFEGDTLASALLANGVRVTGRSFKYHRPRGLYSAGEEEPNAFVSLLLEGGQVANYRATRVTLQAGLEAHSQLGWPSVDFDLGRIFDYSHALWPAGFYNKTFKWPNWHVWEGMIRRMAGLGPAPELAHPLAPEVLHQDCDLLICGGGPAGLIAARVAGRAGLRVILADQSSEMGGSLLWESRLLDEKPARSWLELCRQELSDLPNVLVLPRTQVTAAYDHQLYTLVESGASHTQPECLWKVRARVLLLASGAIEQSMLFGCNDLPGIMLADSVRHYANRYGVAAGKRLVLATTNDSCYDAAADLSDHGIDVRAVVDQRTQVQDELLRRMQQREIRVITGHQVVAARGGHSLSSVQLRSVNGTSQERLRCDTLGVSGGWSPRLHLLCHAGGRLQFAPLHQAFMAQTLPKGVFVTGSAAGVSGLSEVMARAERDAHTLCARLNVKAHHVHLPQISPEDLRGPGIAQQSPVTCRQRQWLDLAHDVTVQDAELAVREGYTAVEHFKRFTTTGMSIDQGKTGNVNAFVTLARLTGKTVDEVGTTTFRPPYMPVNLKLMSGTPGGEAFRLRRYLPAHRNHLDWGGVMEDYGWQRPDYYPRKGESASEAVKREVLAVRSGAGLFDNSPLGKIEVWGPDAARFLDRVYLNNVLSLAEGRCRYGLMLNEKGVIIDDGVFTRLAADQFLVNTTSAGASNILAHLERLLQIEWPDLQVGLDDQTLQWANFTIAGPRSRELLLRLSPALPISAEELPHMAAVCTEIDGVPIRVLRISFSGELSFEVNIPAAQASAFASRLMELGEDLPLRPYGIEALMILRLEKGYLHVGTDTDGETIPDDIGWGSAANKKGRDFIGRRSLRLSANRVPDRRQLVGLKPAQPGQKLHAGMHLLAAGTRQVPAQSQGWLTSAAFSPTLGHDIALAMLQQGRQRIGERVTVYDNGIFAQCTVAGPTFYDPDNQRLQS